MTVVRRVRSSSWLTAVAIAVAGLVVFGTLGWAGALALDSLGPPSPPHHPDNVSWRYGADVMSSQLYDRANYGDVDGACRRALAHPRGGPRPFEFAEAMAGCRYREWSLDN